MKRFFEYTTVAAVLIFLSGGLPYQTLAIPQGRLQELRLQVQNEWIPSLSEITFYVSGNPYRITQNADVESLAPTFIEPRSRAKQKVLSLALFYIQTKSDPLLYSPDLNISNWKKIISRLEDARTNLLGITQAYLPQKDRGAYLEIISHPDWVYPLEFLRKFSEVVELQELFLANPSDIRARALIRKQELAARAYKNSAEGHEKLLELLPSALNSQTFIYLGSATALPIVSSDFELIARNGNELEHEIALRKQCVISGHCKTGDALQAEKKVAVSPIHKEHVDQPLIPIELITPPHTEKQYGPFSIASNCWEKWFVPEPKRWPMYLFVSEYAGIRTALPMLANENFYLDVRKSKDPSDQEKVKRGIFYNDQAATNTYMCNNNSFYPQIMTLAYLQEKVKAEGAIIPEEMYLIDSPMPSDTILPILEDQYAASKNPEAVERLLITQNKLAGFDLALGKIYELMGVYVDITYLNKQAYPVFSLLGERSSYSLLYMPFAKSVWRIQDSPAFLQPGLYQRSNLYLNWKEFTSAGYDPYQARVWDTELNKEIVKEVREARGEMSGSELFSLFQNFLTSLYRIHQK
ncbi:hypothetical protein A3D62_01590 [Candidatus Kaiserbacteria bacterium RIFCSPHIGHO2_02_FULL_49_11]|uniref:Uncharacterized protein n=1 Tax=Candidatus Kaiserbacteria bacterium RIFCSPHIGHO2_02_FULL_49_11 TaxID=1798489 RepID=A0A1F6D1R2_9BACT|nr:MAG: hypothetical protein A3D62_01590 [Candidatus Kaiserbacteria bacterium RIFCSPHIGHO2_02_FULL_49_11]